MASCDVIQKIFRIEKSMLGTGGQQMNTNLPQLNILVNVLESFFLGLRERNLRIDLIG